MSGLEPGTRFEGRYDIVGLLGEGGMGVVYEARHAFTGKQVAIKLLHEHIARSSTASKRFLREAQAPNAIEHPGLVEVIDAGQTEDGGLYLVMERLVGRDLADILSAGGLSAEALVGYVVELLDALHAAHERGLVHRDIKPENVFVLDEPMRGGRVKLLDFGISGLTERGTDGTNLTRTGTIIGTPLYMSPEQARGDRVDVRADVWSVGALLFQALTGRPHFDGTNYNMLIAKILTEAPPPVRSVREDLSPALAEVIDRALATDPAERWPNAAAMRDALAAAPAVLGNMSAIEMGMAATAASDGAATPKPPSQPPPPARPAPSAAPPAHAAHAAASTPPPAETPRAITTAPGHASPGAPTMYAADAAPTQAPAKRRSFLPFALLGLLALGCVAGGVVMIAPTLNPPRVTVDGVPVHGSASEGEQPSEDTPSDTDVTVEDIEAIAEAAEAMEALGPREGDGPAAGEEREETPATEDDDVADAMDLLRDLDTDEGDVQQTERAIRAAQRLQERRDRRRRVREEARRRQAARAACTGACNRERHACIFEDQGNPRAAHGCGLAWQQCQRRCAVDHPPSGR